MSNYRGVGLSIEPSDYRYAPQKSMADVIFNISMNFTIIWENVQVDRLDPCLIELENFALAYIHVDIG